MFDSFEHRGRVFKEEVKKIATEAQRRRA
jgi:hypothetical protein